MQQEFKIKKDDVIIDMHSQLKHYFDNANEIENEIFDIDIDGNNFDEDEFEYLNDKYIDIYDDIYDIILQFINYLYFYHDVPLSNKSTYDFYFNAMKMLYNVDKIEELLIIIKDQ